MQDSPDRDVNQESVAPIMYLTLTAEHLPQVHDILHRSFWSGIDGLSIIERRILADEFLPFVVSDSLQHVPEQATIVAMYKRLVVGCAILSSPVETYITYLAVRAGWENAQIATYVYPSLTSRSLIRGHCSAMLFHLIDCNLNKDITLHVSANNPAVVCSLSAHYNQAS